MILVKESQIKESVQAFICRHINKSDGQKMLKQKCKKKKKKKKVFSLPSGLKCEFLIIKYFCFGLLVRQNKESQVVTLGSGDIFFSSKIQIMKKKVRWQLKKWVPQNKSLDDWS